MSQSRDPASADRGAGDALYRHKASGAGIFTASVWQVLGSGLKLSARELEIVRGIFEDLTEDAIAGNLGISPHTVHTHVERLYHKLEVSDRVQLVVRVMDEFLALTLSGSTALPPLCAKWQAGLCPDGRPQS